MSYNMYTEIILDLYRYPHNKGTLDTPDVSCNKKNVICGDDLTLYLNVEDGVITGVAYDGHGCAISQASASLLTDEIKGKSIDEIKKLSSEKVMELLGIPISPVREKCALLIYEALQGVLENVRD